jgi:hypothetical protein
MVTASPEELQKHKEEMKVLEEGEREEPHVKFGKMLYSRVFSGELGEYFQKSINEIQETGDRLRISLRGCLKINFSLFLRFYLDQSFNHYMDHSGIN